jgi:Plasmid encoded RepA protein
MMGRVHELIELKGRAGAILALQDECDRRVVDTAAAYMADEENGVGFIFSGWAQAALPHRRLKTDDAVWQLETERVKLMVEPGRRPMPGGDPLWVGVPYGSRARLIMLYLQTEALRTGRREIELGRSLHAWLGRLSIPIGGKSFRDVREQAERISRCRMTFQISQGGRTGLVNQHILDTAMFVEDGQDGQGNLFIETARLSEMFFEQLQKHPVPLEEAAIRAINNNSQALDIYCWLAYRLHVLPGPREISWKSLHAQFGAGFARLDHFRTKFIENLKLATAVYRDAAIEVSKSGLILKPSRAPIAPRQVAISR